MLSGCINLSDLTSCWMCDAPPPDTYAIGPDSTRMVVGDTVQLATCTDMWKSMCGMGGSFAGSVLSRWTLDPDTAARFWNGAELTVVPNAYTVTLRARKPGRAVVRATYNATGDTSSIVVFVHDSSAITAIDIASVSDLTFRVGWNSVPTVRLIDNAEHQFRTAPTGITVSDTSVMAVTAVEGATWGTMIRLTGRKAGDASVTVSFRTLSKTLPFTVLP